MAILEHWPRVGDRCSIKGSVSFWQSRCHIHLKDRAYIVEFFRCQYQVTIVWEYIALLKILITIAEKLFEFKLSSRTAQFEKFDKNWIYEKFQSLSIFSCLRPETASLLFRPRPALLTVIMKLTFAGVLRLC